MASKYNQKMKKDDGGVETGGWQIVYSGFVLILLCFFIMICSFSTMETSKVTRFVKSFSVAVNIFTGGLNFNKGEIILPVSTDIVDAHSKIANIFSQMSEIMRDYGIEDEMGVYSEKGELTIRLSDAVLFDSGSTDINKKSYPLLKKIGNIIADTGYDIRIEGHSDNLPINTEKYPSNWELSTSRAIMVLRYFIAENRIPPERLSAEGFAEYRPVVENDTKENRAHNRRVEIKIFDGSRKGLEWEQDK